MSINCTIRVFSPSAIRVLSPPKSATEVALNYSGQNLQPGLGAVLLGRDAIQELAGSVLGSQAE